MLTTTTDLRAVHASAPSIAGLRKRFSVSSLVLVANELVRGAEYGTLRPMPAQGCAITGTEADNGWFHTPKFGTTRHSQRGRSAA